MPPDRAGYTVTMFIIDVSPSMGNIRTLELPPGPNGETRTKRVTHLEWAMQYVMLKVQEMIYAGRKTDQCGVILFGSEETDNCVNVEHGGYEHVTEYIPIAQPTSETLDRIAAIHPSSVEGDAIDGLIVAIQTQQTYLGKKASWTRKIVILTDGESPLETADWEDTVDKLNTLQVVTTIVGVDFDDDNYTEENKSGTKSSNEAFWKEFETRVHDCLLGSCYAALQDCALPEIKQVKPTAKNTYIRLGDYDARGEEAIEISVKVLKVTARVPIPTMQKYTKRERIWDSQRDRDGDEDMGSRHEPSIAPLERRTEYGYKTSTDEDDVLKIEEDTEEKESTWTKVESEELVSAYRYGANWIPCQDELFKLPTKAGIEIVGFVRKIDWERSYEMGEVYCAIADPKSSRAQLAFSSLIRAMSLKSVLAIVRWVQADDAEPKMAACNPVVDSQSDYLFMVRIPFAEDVRNYTFASLDTIRNKDGKQVTKHPYLTNNEMVSAMDRWVDKMDLTEAGIDDQGEPAPWFDVRKSYNPAIHRTKQALFHSAIVEDMEEDPLPPPHPELTKYLNPPEEVVKRSAKALEKLKAVLDVKIVAPKETAKKKKLGEVDGTMFTGDDFSLADIYGEQVATSSASARAFSVTGIHQPTQSFATGTSTLKPSKPDRMDVDDEDTEDEGEILSPSKGKGRNPLPTPVSPTQVQSQNFSTGGNKDVKPGRIIGNSHPLRDFRKNLERGDVVSKALEDMGAIIPEILESSFSTQRYQEALECMKEMRKTALEEDDVDIWNTFLQNFKDQCKGRDFKSGDFWAQVQDVGMALSLITSKEADKNETYSEFSELQAVQFIND